MEDIRSLGCVSRTVICVLLGVLVATVYFVLASLSRQSVPETLDMMGWTWAGLALFYYGVAAAGGVVVGVLLPIARRRAGAWALAYLVSGFYMVPIFISIEPDWSFAILIWLTLGPVVGLMMMVLLWEPPTEGSEE
jgi:hypothetical protein